MSIIYTPPEIHKCNPGAIKVGGVHGTERVDPRKFPRGTIWLCECGQTWYSTTDAYLMFLGVTNFRKERWYERWYRERFKMS